MTDSSFELRWGIISTGAIATRFAKDLLMDPTTRDTFDVQHRIVAVASRSLEGAKRFIRDACSGDETIKAYASYEQIWKDQDVDAIYIGTPHSHHYVPALSAISHGKHVLCEKPMTTNAQELVSLKKAAQEHKVFLMEAMWTRFQPLFIELLELLSESEERLGRLAILTADLSMDFNIENLPKTDRILDPHLAGGGLLDLGPYPLVWTLCYLFNHPKVAKAIPAPEHISTSMHKTPLTGVDANTIFTIQFPTIPAQAILSTHIDTYALPAPAPCVTMRFQKGAVEIGGAPYRPTSYTIKYYDSEGKVEKEFKRSYNRFGSAGSDVGSGLHWQADEVARCIRDKKTESDKWGLDMSLCEMKIFDEVRKQGGYVFPPGVEHVN